MAVKWFVDEGLNKLIAQWKAEHPGATVFTIGDASHQSHTSEHNPEFAGSAPGADANEVDAADFMPGNGVTMDDLRELRNDLIEVKDPRFLYAIVDLQIVSSVVEPWKIRKYTGKKHTHLHVSVNDKFDKNTKSWDIDGKDPVVARKYTYKEIPGTFPELQYGDEDRPGETQHITRIQGCLNAVYGAKLDTDGVYGANTKSWVKKVMADDKARSSTDGSKIYVPEMKRILGIW